MSEHPICPLCGGFYLDPNYCLHQARDLIAEISRLKAELKNGQELLAYAMAEGNALKDELERAERENDRLQSALKEEVSIASNFAEVSMMRTTQRDEARRLARHFYREYLVAQQYVDDYAEWSEV